MNPIQAIGDVLRRTAACGTNIAMRLAVSAALFSLWLETTPLALAAKGKQEAAPLPEKSYVVPYMIVITLLGLGLMTVLRPSSRAEKVDEKLMRQQQEDE